MKVILLGASGMVGQGVLRECLQDPDVSSVLSIGRTALGRPQAKFHEIIHHDFFNLTPIEASLTGYDACFYCLGVSSVGMTEAAYKRITCDITLNVAKTLARLNPQMTFIYVSGMGTDSTERGRSMWARVKGKTENDLQKLPFKVVYLFRPAMIQPMHGIKSKTAFYQIFLTLAKPILPLFPAWFPKYATTTERVGRAMLRAVKRGYPRAVLESLDINALGK